MAIKEGYSVTKNQYLFLHQKGYTDDEIAKLNVRTAIELIGNIKRDWEESAKKREEWLNEVIEL